MKKAISILAAAVLMAGMMSVTALARGRQGGGARQLPRYELCTVDGCDLQGPHLHNDVWYCSQSGGYVCFEICPEEGCTQIGVHEHDGVYYRPAGVRTGLGCARGRGR